MSLLDIHGGPHVGIFRLGHIGLRAVCERFNWNEVGALLDLYRRVAA